jgi:hypothetical protein
MPAHAASPTFTERTRQSWRALGYGGMAIAGLSTLHVSTPLLALIAMAFILPPIWNLVQSHRERNGDKLPAATALEAGVGDRREFAALPFGGLFGKWKAELPFEEMITEAAYCSNEYGRRLSVICVRIPGLSRVMRDLVANLLRMNVRAKDEVEVVSDDEFIVCSHLLRDAAAADIILKRLEGALRKADLFSEVCEIQIGKAVYPMHGYTGADLISYARSQLQPIAGQA